MFEDVGQGSCAANCHLVRRGKIARLMQTPATLADHESPECLKDKAEDPFNKDALYVVVNMYWLCHALVGVVVRWLCILHIVLPTYGASSHSISDMRLQCRERSVSKRRIQIRMSRSAYIHDSLCNIPRVHSNGNCTIVHFLPTSVELCGSHWH
jgi:hypothetical protein